MRVSTGSTWGPSVLVSLVLGLSSTALATDFTVGAVDDPSINAYLSLSDAISAANADGAEPHLITIDSAAYDSVAAGDARPAGECDDHDQPMPIIQRALTITSSGASAASVPPLSSRDDLTLTGITVHSGIGRALGIFQDTRPRCTGPLIGMENGTLTMTDTDLVLRPGDASTTGVQSTDSDLVLTDVTVTGLRFGIIGDQFFADELTATLTNVTMPESDVAQTGIQLYGFSGGELTDVSIDEHSYAAMEFEGGAWVLNGGALTNGGYGIRLTNGAVDIDGTLFDDNLEQAIYADGFSDPGVHVQVSNVTFNAHAGEEGGAIRYVNNTVSGSLVIEDSTFTNNFAFIGGSIYAVGQVFLDGIVASGTADADAFSGGFMRLMGSGIIKNSSFTDFDAESGGVIALGFEDEDFDRIADGVLTIEDTTFENASADLGGVFHIFGGSTAELFDVSASSVFAVLSGGFAHLNVLEDQGFVNEREIPVDALTTMVNEAGAGGIIMTDVDVTDSLAGNGGVIGASGVYNEIEARGLTVTGTEAASIFSQSTFRGLPGVPLSNGGRGGLLWVADGSRVYLEGLQIEDSSAEEYGGLIYSGPSLVSDIFQPQGGILFDDCRPPLANVDQFFDADRLGNTITINGMSVAGVSAGFDAGIAVFADLDDVSLHAADFVGVRTGEDRRGEEPIEFTSAHILTENVSRYDMSCVSVCDAASGSASNPDAIGGTVRHYEAASYSDDRTRRPVISHENNTFSYNAAASAVVAIEVCAPEEFDTGIRDTFRDTFGDTFRIDSGEFRAELSAEGTFRDTDSGITIDPRPRGRVDVQFTTFVGSPDSVLIGGTAQDVPVIISNNLFGEGAVGIGLDDTDYLFGEYNLFSAVDSVAQDAAAQVFPTPTAIQQVAQFTNLVQECSEQELWLLDGSPGQDGADPDLLDWWNDSPADVGAFGGPDACFPDVDEDGFIVVLDCNDNDLEIRPGANETPYDEIDQDCDGEDWCDVDGDGFLSDALTCGGDDCDDARADINPEQTEIWYDGIDQDCSGDDCDQDGDGYAADNAECGGPDCDDLDASVYPGAPETDGDGTDSDCDGADNIPPGCDEDGDGVIADSVECGGIDCDDTDATIYPGAPETAGDGVDSDCNGDDDPPISEDRCDDDGDGVVSVDCDGIDCDDADATIYPGAEDIPYDGIDQDCDGEDNCDADNDGFDAPECGGDDCNDTDPAIFPGAGEVPNDGVDQDCDLEDGDLWVQGGPSGCDCSATGGSAPMGMMWLGALGLALLRRRRS